MSNQSGEKTSETANAISIRSKIMLPKIPVFLRWIWPLYDSTILSRLQYYLLVTFIIL